MVAGTGASAEVLIEHSGIPTVPAIVMAREALRELGLYGKVSLIASGGIRNGADVAKALALGADAVAIGIGALVALNCNKEIPESDFVNEIGVPAGQCRHCHTGKCPVGITTQDPELTKRLDPDEAAERVANYLNSMTMELALLTRSLGKGDVHSLEPEDMAALTIEASAMAQVPLGRYQQGLLSNKPAAGQGSRPLSTGRSGAAGSAEPGCGGWPQGDQHG